MKANRGNKEVEAAGQAQELFCTAGTVNQDKVGGGVAGDSSPFVAARSLGHQVRMNGN
jgi:hypothetical protein